MFRVNSSEKTICIVNLDDDKRRCATFVLGYFNNYSYNVNCNNININNLMSSVVSKLGIIFKKLLSLVYVRLTWYKCKSPMYSNISYICHVCGIGYNSKKGRTLHMKTHDVSTYGTKTFTTSSVLSDHVRLHTEKREVGREEGLFECDLCDKKYGSSTLLIRHIESHIDKKPYKCEFCGKGFNERHNLKIHKRIHSGEAHYKCSTCGAAFKTRYFLKVHRAAHAGEKPFECDECGKGFKINNALAVHKKIHIGEKPYGCDADSCGARFVSKYALNEHVARKHTDVKPFECSTCGKCFATEALEAIHSKIHQIIDDEDMFICDIAGCCARFKKKHGLKSHVLRIHTDIKPFKCDMCDVRFASMQFLKIHAKTHTKTINTTNTASKCQLYECDVCKMQFGAKRSLKQHMSRHDTIVNDTNLIECNICDDKFITVHELIEHKKQTHAVSEFGCDVCGRTFRLNTHLVSHLKSHSKSGYNPAFKTTIKTDPPYKCDWCDKSYTTEHSLKLHAQTHTNLDLHTCHLCPDKKYQRLVSLQRHMIKTHEVLYNTQNQIQNQIQMIEHSTEHSTEYSTEPTTAPSTTPITPTELDQIETCDEIWSAYAWITNDCML